MVVADLVGRVLAEASVPIGGDTGPGPPWSRRSTLVERAAKEAGADRAAHRRHRRARPGRPGHRRTPRLHRAARLAPPARRRPPGAAARGPRQRRERDQPRRRSPSSATARPGTATPSSCSGSATASGAAVVLDGALRRGASGGTGEIGFLPVPGTSALPSATDCEGGFHSLAAVGGGRGTGRGARDVGSGVGGRRWSGRRSTWCGGRRPGGAAEAASLGGPAPASPSSTPSPTASPSAPPRSSPILDPGCVVLGGEVGQAGGDALAARVRDRLARMTPLPTEVRASTLGGGAVLRGALLTARDRAQDELFEPGGVGRPDGGQGPSSPPPGRSAG